MKALTIKQPWACAIAAGHKTVENRTWSTRYRGPLAIHASATYDRKQPTEQWAAACDVYALARPELMEQSAVLAVAQLVDCHPWTPGCCESPWAESGLRVHHFVLAGVRTFAKPILNVRGALGLWMPGPDLLTELQQAREAVR